MIRRWLEYTGAPFNARKDKIYVSLNQKGMFLINRFAYSALGSPKAVKLFYDPTNGVIGMRASLPDAPNAFKLTEKDGNFAIRGNTFIRHYRIDIRETVTFHNAFMESNILVLDIRMITPVSRPPKRRKESTSVIGGE